MGIIKIKGVEKNIQNCVTANKSTIMRNKIIAS